jgi:transcriptional regulator with XRE-family HTH domain
MQETYGEKRILKKLGGRIQQLRRGRGISQEKLAHAAGISRVYEGYIEQGRSSPSVGKLHRIAKHLNVPLYELFRF